VTTKRSEVYFHDGNLATLSASLVLTNKRFYTLINLGHKAVYQLQRDGTGKKVCLVRDLIDDSDPFPPLPSEQKTPQDAAFDAAMRTVVEGKKESNIDKDYDITKPYGY
jgi:hypothetical protein